MLINDEATRQVAEILGNALGVGFTLRNAAIADGAAHIEYPDGRAVGFRPIFGGAIVQLWIIGNAKPASEGEPPTLRLLEGQTYHAAISLLDTEDDDPADLLLGKLTDDLLPAFEFKPHYVGHRPWEDVFNNALADSIAEQSSRARPSETGEEPPHADMPGEAEVREPDVEPAEPADVTPTVEEPAAEPDALPAAKTRKAATGGTEKAPARPRKTRRRTTAAPSSG